MPQGSRPGSDTAPQADDPDARLWRSEGFDQLYRQALSGTPQAAVDVTFRRVDRGVHLPPAVDPADNWLQSTAGEEERTPGQPSAPGADYMA